MATITHQFNDEGGTGGFYIVKGEKGVLDVFSWDVPNQFTKFMPQPPATREEAKKAAEG